MKLLYTNKSLRKADYEVLNVCVGVCVFLGLRDAERVCDHL